MFVLCWKITSDQDHDIANLKNWLLRIQVFFFLALGDMLVVLMLFRVELKVLQS